MSKRAVRAIPPATATGDESVSVAWKLAESYREMARFLRDQMELPAEEAFKRAADPGCAADERDQMLAGPPDQVSWIGLQQLYGHDPDAGQAVWDHLKQVATEHLASGHTAAEALEYRGRPWERAQFLALRQAFTDEWQPQGGIELTLVDLLAQAHSSYLFWLAELHVRSTLEVKRDESTYFERGYWNPPRMEAGAAIDQAAVMVERFNRIFLRTLRALRDLRRYGPVVVHQAGQVNVGQQQVNVMKSSYTEDVIE
jgi:hypothetical protein